MKHQEYRLKTVIDAVSTRYLVFHESQYFLNGKSHTLIEVCGSEGIETAPYYHLRFVAVFSLHVTYSNIARVGVEPETSSSLFNPASPERSVRRGKRCGIMVMMPVSCGRRTRDECQ